MNIVHKIQQWEHARHHVLQLLMRVMVGIVITFKGIFFLSNIQALDSMLLHSQLYRFAATSWTYYISLSSLLCGIFLIIGLFTRWAATLQLPLLMAAVLFINPGEQAGFMRTEFLLSIIVLVLLIYFLWKGPGEVSMDNYLKNHEL